ncbi:MAG: exo-alpha-sialidase [Rubrivivax sp.]
MHPIRSIRLAAVRLALTLLGLLGAAAPAPAQGHAAHEPAPAASAAAPGAAYAAMSPFQCAGNGLDCATAATPAWGPDGALWLAWVANGDVVVARSPDGNGAVQRPVVVGRYGAFADIGPDARPQIVVDARGRAVVAFAVFKDEQWNAQVLVSTSDDNGASFSAPQPVSDDAASQRFPALALAPDGALFIAWVDKRLVAAAARQGRRVPGAAIAYAWSADGGTRFGPARIAHASSCECCRIGVAVPAAQHPVLVFRDLAAPGVRDHALLSFTAAGDPGPLHRVAVDDWQLDACPHHGPALAVGAQGRLHVAWYTQGRQRQGVFHAWSADGGRRFSRPMRLGRADVRAGRPAVLARGSDVWLAWKSFDGRRSTLFVQRSRDAGRTWAAPQPRLATAGYSDHPLLGWRGDEPMLSWLTHDEGLHVQNLRSPS